MDTGAVDDMLAASPSCEFPTEAARVVTGKSVAEIPELAGSGVGVAVPGSVGVAVGVMTGEIVNVGTKVCEEDEAPLFDADGAVDGNTLGA